MRSHERQRDRESDPRPPSQQPGGSAAPNDASLRRADALLQAADDAVRRALSANSEEFLAAVEQEGGQ
jgi:hypothetical protein